MTRGELAAFQCHGNHFAGWLEALYCGVNWTKATVASQSPELKLRGAQPWLLVQYAVRSAATPSGGNRVWKRVSRRKSKSSGTANKSSRSPTHTGNASCDAMRRAWRSSSPQTVLWTLAIWAGEFTPGTKP